MKQSLQSILGTQSIYDFSSAKFKNSMEKIPSFNYSQHLTPPQKEVKIVVISNKKPKKIIPNWTIMTPTNRPLILLNNLIKDAEEPPFSKTNYSASWSTSHKHRQQINYTPPIKKNVLLIKSQEALQPPVGYYEPKLLNKIRGSVRLHRSSQSVQQSANSNVQVTHVEQKNDQSPTQQVELSDKKLLKFLDNESTKLKFRQSFQLNPKDLEDHPFKKQLETFKLYKNRIKILKDLRYIE